MGKRRRLLRWAVLATLLAGVAVSSVAAARGPAQEPESAAGSEKLPAAEIQVLNRLRQLVSALAIYRSLYQGYPGSLAQLGPPAEGSPSQDAADLIPVSLAAGESGEYLLEYVATNAAPEGGATAYEVRALPRESTSSPQRSFFVNQSGHIRYTLEKRKARADDPVFEHPAYSQPGESDEEAADAEDEAKKDSPALERGEMATLNRVKRIVQVLDIYRKRYGAYPAALVRLGPPEDGPPTEEAARLISRQLANGSAQGYLFVYRAKPAASASLIDGYELKVRPQTYGDTGRASFYADESAVIHVTAEDRAAGPDDPTVD